MHEIVAQVRTDMNKLQMEINSLKPEVFVLAVIEFAALGLAIWKSHFFILFIAAAIGRSFWSVKMDKLKTKMVFLKGIHAGLLGRYSGK